MWLPFLTLLILLPILVYRFVRHRAPRHRFGATGAVFGAVVSPWALGLYSWFFLSPYGVIIGFVGLALTVVHEVPGFELAVHLGVVPRGEIVSGIIHRVCVEGINAIVWALCYGLLGSLVDRFLQKKLPRTPEL
jgi:hypothetical protein